MRYTRFAIQAASRNSISPLLHTWASGTRAPAGSPRAAAITPRVIQWLGATPLRSRSNWPMRSSSSRPLVATDFLKPTAIR